MQHTSCNRQSYHVFWQYLTLICLLAPLSQNGFTQEISGNWSLSMNGEKVSSQEFQTFIFCADRQDIIQVSFVPDSTYATTSYLYTGIELWVQAFMNQPQFIGKYQREEADSAASIQFSMSDLIAVNSLPPGETAFSAAIRIKPILLIQNSRISETLQIPQDLQELSITLVRECD